MKKLFALALFCGLMLAAETADAQRFTQRTTTTTRVRGGGFRRNDADVNVFVNGGFVPQAVFVQPSFQPVFVAPQAIYAAPTSFQAFGGGCNSGFRVQSFSGGCW
jgi:hypothetical protein